MSRLLSANFDPGGASFRGLCRAPRTTSRSIESGTVPGGWARPTIDGEMATCFGATCSYWPSREWRQSRRARTRRSFLRRRLSFRHRRASTAIPPPSPSSSRGAARANARPSTIAAGSRRKAAARATMHASAACRSACRKRRSSSVLRAALSQPRSAPFRAAQPTTTTQNRRGPCAPVTRRPPTSAVRDGPDTRLSVRGIVPRP